VSLAFMPVTLFGIGRLAIVRPALLRVLLALGGALQLWYLLDALRDSRSLTHLSDLVPLDRYSAHFGALGRWLPALYDTGTALGHVPNAVAVVAVVWLVVLGALWREPGRASVTA
jgi:hypothetical protein